MTAKPPPLPPRRALRPPPLPSRSPRLVRAVDFGPPPLPERVTQRAPAIPPRTDSPSIQVERFDLPPGPFQDCEAETGRTSLAFSVYQPLVSVFDQLEKQPRKRLILLEVARLFVDLSEADLESVLADMERRRDGR